MNKSFYQAAAAAAGESNPTTKPQDQATRSINHTRTHTKWLAEMDSKKSSLHHSKAKVPSIYKVRQDKTRPLREQKGKEKVRRSSSMDAERDRSPKLSGIKQN